MSQALRIYFRQSTARTLLAALLLTLVACKAGNYRYVLNDNVVYDPSGAGNTAASALRDPALQACLNQVLAAQGSADLTQVKLLACSGNGVETLIGIGSLTALEQLEISDNKISDLRSLAPLKNLRVLGLRNNPIDSISVLANLQLLRFVSLQGTDKLPCREVAVLKTRLGNTLTAPDHCIE